MIPPWLAASAIVAATVLVYLNAFGNAFLWDDRLLVVDNTAIKHWGNIARIFTHALFPEGIQSRYYRPLQTFTYLVDYHLWGLRPWGFHLTNTLLHAGTAVLLYRFGTVVLGDPLAALVAALLFAVHPIHTEAVTYVSGRSDPLAALCMLAAALWFLRGGGRLVLSVVAFLLALLAREAAMVLPLLLVVVDVGVTTARRRRWSVYLPYAGVLALYLLLRTTVIGGGAREALAAAVPLRLRLLTMAKVVVEYLGLLIVPLHLHMERLVRPATSLLVPSILASVAVIAGLVAAILAHRRETWPLGFGLAWFFVALLPVANIVPLSTFMAEHWLYVPSMGCFLAAGWGVARLADRLPRRAVMATAAIILASYAGATIRRNADWRDGPTLYQTMLPLAPESPRLYGNLGQTYQEAGDNEKAKTAYEHVLELTNNDLERAMALNNLGKLYRDEKRYRESLATLDRALALDPRLVGAHNNRALTLFEMGRGKEAKEALEAALRLDASSAPTHNNLGYVRFLRGDVAGARREYLAAIRLDPDYARAYSNLGTTYLWTGQPDRAADAYREALRIDPGLTEAARYLDLFTRRAESAPE